MSHPSCKHRYEGLHTSSNGRRTVIGAHRIMSALPDRHGGPFDDEQSSSPRHTSVNASLRTVFVERSPSVCLGCSCTRVAANLFRLGAPIIPKQAMLGPASTRQRPPQLETHAPCSVSRTANQHISAAFSRHSRNVKDL